MADTLVDNAVFSVLRSCPNGGAGPYWLSSSTGAIIFIDADGDFTARKTTDGGATWGSRIEAAAGSFLLYNCWFDRQTPGDAGTKVHTVFTDQISDDFWYAAFDISAGTWSTPVLLGNLTVRSRTQFITKSRSGLLYAHASNATIGVGHESLFVMSNDGGATWDDTLTSPSESAQDPMLGVTCNTGDDDDCAVIFLDDSADELSIKVYDASADTWTETSIETSITPTQGSYNFWDVATRLSDGHAILVCQIAPETGSNSIEAWDLDIDSVSAPTVTALQQLIFFTADIGSCPSVMVDHDTDDIYAGYVSGAVLGDSVSAKWRICSDGATWGSAATISEDAAEDLRYFSMGACGLTGGRVQPWWFDDDDNDIFVNLTNDVEITGVTFQEGAVALALALALAPVGQHTEAGATALTFALAAAIVGSRTQHADAVLPLALTLAGVARRDISADAVLATTLSLAADGNFGIVEGEAPLALALTLAAAGSRVQSVDLAMALELALSPVPAIRNDGAAALALALTLLTSATTIRFHRAARPPAGLGTYTMRPQAGSGRMRP